MKITSIKQQQKNPDRANISIDGSYAFSLSLNELVAEKLKINQDIDDAELKRLKKISLDGKLKARALEWVLNRPRSLRELRDYLFRKRADTDLAQKIISEFDTKGYVNDRTFAAWLIDMRTRGGKSWREIKNELARKGVNRELITEIAPKDTNQERQLLKQLVEKKRRLSRYKNDELKLKQYLMRHGFDYEDIKAVFSDNH